MRGMAWTLAIVVLVTLLASRSPAQTNGANVDRTHNAERQARPVPFHGFRARKSYRPNEPSRPTICLIHGMNSSSGGFHHLIPPLEDAGFGVVVYDYPYNRDLDATAPDFVRDWVTFRERVGETRPWAVLSHSMGGLLARYYVEGPDYRRDVSDLILIAPTNAGSSLAKAQTLLQLVEGILATSGKPTLPANAVEAEVGEAAEDILPGSRFLKRLNALPRREGVEYHILAGNAGFLDIETRRKVESRYRMLMKSTGLLGGLVQLAGGEVLAGLDELTDGTGDGAVTVASTRLDGVAEPVVIPSNHVELIRGPMFYADPGPVVCMPYVLRWLGVGESGHVETDDPTPSRREAATAVETSP